MDRVACLRVNHAGIHPTIQPFTDGPTDLFTPPSPLPVTAERGPQEGPDALPAALGGDVAHREGRGGGRALTPSLLGGSSAFGWSTQRQNEGLFLRLEP